jgi:hypothetical protein
MRSRFVVAVALFGLLGGACAGLSEAASSSSSSPGPKTITVGFTDTQAVLHVGDTLVFHGTGELMPPGSTWNLLQYPRNLLDVVPTRNTFTFVFRARHAGVGMLQVSVGPRCYSAGPPVPAAAGPPCPVANPKDVKGGLGGIPIRAYTITVKVYAQGTG